MSLEKAVPRLDFHRTAHEYVVDTKPAVAVFDCRRPAAGDYSDVHPHLAGQLYGIAVLDVDGAQGLAFAIGRYCRRGENSVNIEHYGSYLAQIVVYHCFLSLLKRL